MNFCILTKIALYYVASWQWVSNGLVDDLSNTLLVKQLDDPCEPCLNKLIYSLQLIRR